MLSGSVMSDEGSMMAAIFCGDHAEGGRPLRIADASYRWDPRLVFSYRWNLPIHSQKHSMSAPGRAIYPALLQSVLLVFQGAEGEAFGDGREFFAAA